MWGGAGQGLFQRPGGLDGETETAFEALCPPGMELAPAPGRPTESELGLERAQARVGAVRRAMDLRDPSEGRGVGGLLPPQALEPRQSRLVAEPPGGERPGLLEPPAAGLP